MSYSLTRISSGQVGVKPGRVSLVSTDSLAVITTAGYLQSNVDSQAYIVGLSPNDIVDCLYGYSSNIGSGTLASNMSVTNVKGLITLSSSQSASAWTALSAPGTIDAFSATMNATQLLTSGNIAAIVGQTNYVGTNGAANVYGVLGKISPEGGLASSINAGVFGQIDLSLTSITSAQLAPVWGDMGASATAGTYGGLFGIAMTNNTTAIANAQIYLVGGATSLLELVDNNGSVGPTYFTNAGTGANSWGAVAYAAATKALQININGTNYWIGLKASNS